MWTFLAKVLNIHCSTKADKAFAIFIITLLSPVLIGIACVALAFGFGTAIGIPVVTIYLAFCFIQMTPSFLFATNSIWEAIGMGWLLLLGFLACLAIASFHIYFVWIAPICLHLKEKGIKE